ncbi:OprO/OprP family phosphate-selective porin [Owenweeksia hongkongensis]|uniref:OprO/OprP family phosphate-selective porin n=1 Tax=Owenweeksia hongkongensis TaxID=253245 RepID=UPI003A94E312
MQILKAKTTLIFSIICLVTSNLFGQGDDSTVVKNPNAVQAKYGSKGFEFTTNDNRFKLQIQSRLQFRFATPSDQDPQTFDDYSEDYESVFKINRARFKVGGHAFQPWLKYYWEYDVSQSNLLDFRLMIEKWEWLNFKVGQWKVEFTRERFISSGKQQMVDRSILNRVFTVDRQQGIEVYGRLKGDGIADFNYWIGTFTGTGLGNGSNDDSHLMYFARGQWNFLGREVKFEGNDVDISEKPAGIIAVATVSNRSPYTRFSSGGGGSLPGFENGDDGQYRVNQLNIETAFVYKGFSWQSELHQKEITDRLSNASPEILHGYYGQAGYFFNQLIGWWPKPLELAARHAGYFPDRGASDRIQHETSLAANWFFAGHKNKLTMEISRFDAEDLNFDYQEQWRFRIQWDISI